MVFLAALILVPIWRLATAKGYNGKAFVLATGIPAFIANTIGLVLAPRSDIAHLIISWAVLGIPVLTLVLAAALPTRPGAPGSAWLTISFPCPGCGKPLSFNRELEGLKRRCPHCDERFTIRDESEPG